MNNHYDLGVLLVTLDIIITQGNVTCQAGRASAQVGVGQALIRGLCVGFESTHFEGGLEKTKRIRREQKKCSKVRKIPPEVKASEIQV